MGLGFGLVLATVLILGQLVCDEKEKGIDHATDIIAYSSNRWVGLVMGALTQVRMIGGTISLAIW
jgi:hypothetical protein